MVEDLMLIAAIPSSLIYKLYICSNWDLKWGSNGLYKTGLIVFLCNISEHVKLPILYNTVINKINS